jgi:hypothetical protein
MRTRPAVKAKRPLSVQSGDLRRDARQRARRADSRPSRLAPERGGSTPKPDFAVRDSGGMPRADIMARAIAPGMVMIGSDWHSQWRIRSEEGSDRVFERGQARLGWRRRQWRAGRRLLPRSESRRAPMQAAPAHTPCGLRHSRQTREDGAVPHKRPGPRRSAKQRPPSPAFSSSSANTNLSSVIGSSRASG